MNSTGCNESPCISRRHTNSDHIRFRAMSFCRRGTWGISASNGLCEYGDGGGSDADDSSHEIGRQGVKLPSLSKFAVWCGIKSKEVGGHMDVQ